MINSDMACFVKVLIGMVTFTFDLLTSKRVPNDNLHWEPFCWPWTSESFFRDGLKCRNVHQKKWRHLRPLTHWTSRSLYLRVRS